MKELQFGQSPFDTLTREELILHCERLYRATKSLHSSLSQAQEFDPENPYFADRDGLGNRAIEKGRQAMAPIEENYSQEDLYRAYERYIDPLIFENTSTTEVAVPWYICHGCKRMVSTPNPTPDLAQHHTGGCQSAYELLTYEYFRRGFK